MGVLAVRGNGLPRYQSNHTIPKQLFESKTHDIVKLFRDVGGSDIHFDFNGPENLQRLPGNVALENFLGFDAPHVGSHPAMTAVVGERLSEALSRVRGQLGDVINVALDANADPQAREAAKVAVRTEIVNQLRFEVDRIQFKTTNLMDAAGEFGNRMIFNSRDIAYFQETDTFKALSVDARNRILASGVIPTEVLAAHNRLVASAPLTAARALEIKVMRDLGDGLLGMTDGTPAARDSLRAMIAEAQRRGIDLSDRDAKTAFTEIFENLKIVTQALDSQITAVDEAIKTASGPTRASLAAERDALITQRNALQEAHLIGSGTSRASLAQVKAALSDILTGNGRPPSAASRALLKAIGPLVTPGLDFLDVLQLLANVHELMMRRLPLYNDAIKAAYQFMTGKELETVVFAEDNAGTQMLITGTNQWGEPIYQVTVVGRRHDGGMTATTSYIEVPKDQPVPGPWKEYIAGMLDSSITVARDEFARVNRLNGNAPGSPMPDIKYAYTLVNEPGNPFAGYLTTEQRAWTLAPIPEPLMEDPVIHVDMPDVDIEVPEDTPVSVVQLGRLDVSGDITPDLETLVAVRRDSELLTLTAAGLGSMFSSLLMSRLDIEDPLGRIAVSTVLSTFTSDLAAALSSPGLSLSDAFERLPQELRVAGIGAVSSYLWGEVVADLGIDGPWADALTTVGGSAIGIIANNIITSLVDGTPVFQAGAWRSGVPAGLLNAAASFLGTYLASELVQFPTQAGQIGAQLGSAFGAMAIGGLVAGPVGYLVGAFVGYIFGGLIGSLLGGPMKSGAQLTFNQDGQGFLLTGIYTKNGGTAHATNAIAQTVGETLAAILRATGSYLVDADQVRFGEYRARNTRFQYVTRDSNGNNLTVLDLEDVDKIVRLGVLVALADMMPRMVGGNVYMKRAIAASFLRMGIDSTAIPLVKFVRGSRGMPSPIDPATLNIANAFDPVALFGNLSLADEYTKLMQNAAAVSALIQAEPDSTAGAVWAAIIGSAIDLGLHRRGALDWIGGWAAFLDETGNNKLDGISVSPTRLLVGITESRERVFQYFDADGDFVGALGDTIDSQDKNVIVGSGGDDSIAISGSTLGNTAGLTIDGEAATGALLIDVAALIYAEDGNDLVLAGDRGNDVLGGAGDDTLVGGALDDWLFGEDGDDRLFAARPANYQFSDSDATLVALALGTASNGDLLDGGAGNDLLYGSSGSDWLRGGDGVDTLRGGAGADILAGGAGDDRGANGEARILGGSGNDQYVFGYGDGWDVIFDESSPDSLPGFTNDLIYSRMQSIAAGTLARNWGGDGDYVSIDGTVKGGEDAIAFGFGIGLQDLLIRRSGSAATPGNDLIIQLTWVDEAGVRRDLGDRIQIKDWFESSRRVEWLRFTDGEEIRIADMGSYIVGSGLADTIIGTDAADFIYGGAGNDTMFGLNGDDFGFGGDGNDLVAGDEDNDMLSGGRGDDVLIGALGSDTLFGDNGNDSLNGGNGSDLLAGGRGNDTAVGGEGNDIFKFQRGDGSDSIMDAYIDNWEVVYQNGSYINGYLRDAATGVITKSGVVVFDGSKWIGVYDYVNSTVTLRRHLGAVGGALGGNSGTQDTLEFGAGIDIQDLMLQRQGNDLDIAVVANEGDAAFASVSDRIFLRDWYVAGAPIERFAFLATGIHDITALNLIGAGTDGSDILTGTAVNDWITANSGDDTISGGNGDDILVGHGGNDILRGEGGSDVLYGGAGDDVLEGGESNDILVGGSGTDIASYANAASPNNSVRAFLNAPDTNTGFATADQYIGIEGLEGTSGADRLGGDAGDNLLRGRAGNDFLGGGAGDDVYEIDASGGQDTLIDVPFVTEEIIARNGAFNSTQYQASWTHLGVTGSNRAFRLVITRRDTGEEVYRSRDNVDFVYPAATTPSSKGLPPTGEWVSNANQWNASAGVTRPISGSSYTVRERVVAGVGGFDTLDLTALVNVGIADLTFEWLNSGADLRITYASGHFVTILGQNDLNRAVDVLQLRDGLTTDLTRLVLMGEAASTAGDLIIGDGNANTLSGLAGDDVISGGAGNDTLQGGDGDDILEGGAGNDTLDGGNDAVSAGENVDATNVGSYGDTIRYVRSNAAVNINLATRVVSGGHAATDIIVAVSGVSTIENVVGSEGFGDTLTGDARANRLSGLGGNDLLTGNAGNDVLGGGEGNDTLRGGDGDDNLTGEAGDDILEGGNNNDLLYGGDGVDTLSGDAGKDVLTGGAGGDTLRGGADDDSVSGEIGNDQLWGDAGSDELTGGDGDDVLQGGTEDDRLAGDAGADQLWGDAGEDALQGGAGNDTLRGGDGNDSLSGDAGNDQLQGDAGNDRFTFDANSGADTIIDAAGDNSIAFTGVESSRLWLTRAGNDLRIAVIGGSSVVTVQGYYAASSPTRLAYIAADSQLLYTSFAAPLITAMTAASASAPASMPEGIAHTLDDFWFEHGAAAPIVIPQSLSTNEDTALTGSVQATDPDNNVTGYAVATAPALGSLNLNATTGAWTYTPHANVNGTGTFDIRVTDADGNTATQQVTVAIHPANDAPTAINATGVATSIEERDRPPTGTSLPAVVLATLTAADPDAGQPNDFAAHAFMVDDSRFEVVGGELRLCAGTALDFETATSVTVNVTATDRNGGVGGLSVTRAFAFAVTNRDDYFYGTAGVDALTGTAGQNFMYGYGGNDTLTGAGANDFIEGGDGNDILSGLDGNDTVQGQIGDDTLDGGAGDDTLRGGDGIDTLRGGDGIDQLYGDSGNDLLQGGIGSDTLEGGDHNDQLEGGEGNDTLRGQSGDDTLIGGVGADTLVGGAGFDMVTYAGATAGVTLSLAAGTGTAGDASGDVFQDTIERIVGTAFADHLTGSSGNDVLEGGAGNDTIFGGAGNDLLIGGDGNDTLDAQAGNDTLDGGAGSDILIGGDDSDTYRMDLNSGADEIRNFDPNGADIDVIGYDGIANRNLWFERSGNDLVVTAVGTTARTTIKDWYVVTSAADRANYKVDFFLAGAWSARSINAEALVVHMVGYTRPMTTAAYDALHANAAFESGWNSGWNPNAAPTLAAVGTQTINEDGSLSLALAIDDDITPRAGLTVTALAVSPSNHNVADTSIVNATTLVMDGAGNRTLNVSTQPNRSGQTAIKLTVTDAGGLSTTQVFQLDVTPVADAPTLTAPTAASPIAPAIKRTFDGGSIALNLDSSLVDTDGSETLEIRISNVPAGITFNAGSNLGNGVWSFTRAQLAGLQLLGPATWGQDLSLTVSATTREVANGVTATTTAPVLNLEINARPTDIAPNGASIAENSSANTLITTFTRSDADPADSATWALADTMGGRFNLTSGGQLYTGGTNLDFEQAGSYNLTIRVTDSGGLTYSEAIPIIVTNVNEAPTGISVGSTPAFNEGLGAGIGLVTFVGTDPDNNSLTFSLVDTAGGRYSVDAGGLLRAGPTSTNYEAATSHNIVMRVADPGGLFFDRTFTIGVNNVNEAPTVTSLSFTMAEGTYGGPNGAIPGAVLAATDPDGDPLTWTMVNGAGKFGVTASGQLLLASPPLNYEDPNQRSMTITVRASDGVNFVDKPISIAVTDINETPTLVWTPDPASNNLVGYLTGVDPEGGAVIRTHVAARFQIRYERYDGHPEFPVLVTEDWGQFVTPTPNSGWAILQPDGRFTVQGWWNPLIVGDPYQPWPFYEKYTTLAGESILEVRDAAGNAARITIRYIERSDSWVVPVVLDLDGDGVELVSMQDSKVPFAMSMGHQTTRNGWVGADDAMLALDRNGDGVISNGAEISFAGDHPDAMTDLQGLIAFDTNNNNQLDAGDERFGEFRVWNDANQDGVSQVGEVRTLTEASIASLGLLRILTGDAAVEGENHISATADFIRLDGTRGTVADAALAYGWIEATVVDQYEVDPVTGERLDPVAAQPEAEGDIGDVHRTARSPEIIEPLDSATVRRRATPEQTDWSDDRSIDTHAQRGLPREVDPLMASARALRDRPWRITDFDRRDLSDAEWQPDDAAQTGALHAPLSLVARHRLQMIDALASFSPENPAQLELRPLRHVDSRTLELLTSVSKSGSWNR